MGPKPYYINTDFDINKIFHISNSDINDTEYLALLGRWRVVIYWIFQDGWHEAGSTLYWDINFQHFPELRQYGEPLCLDFEYNCGTLVVGTVAGWICTYELATKQLVTTF